MVIDLEKRLNDLKELNKTKDNFNNKIKSQLLNEQNMTDSLTTFHKPVVDKIDETKILALPESKTNLQPAIENTISKFKPYNIFDKEINPKLQAKSLTPTFQNKIVKGNESIL